MNYKPNFYNHFTFQSNFARPNYIPPPPLPPQVLLMPIEQTDEAFIRETEKKLPPDASRSKKKCNISISQVKEQLNQVNNLVRLLKDKEKQLSDNIDTLTDEEWQYITKEILDLKTAIDMYMENLNSNSVIDTVQLLVAKRTAKRVRMKRVRLEKQIEKRERIRYAEERSRKIDENLQKIKDDFAKSKQAEEDKAKADLVLKEVVRKKNNAKKCISKLDALVKLRKARANTACGRGENVSQSETDEFHDSIEKLKSLWIKNLSVYEKEEICLKGKLEQDSDSKISSQQSNKTIEKNLRKWRKFLFGSNNTPQHNFNGDIPGFVDSRRKWDQYIDVNGSALPVGWVLPDMKQNEP